jgi:hypothetical protein
VPDKALIVQEFQVSRVAAAFDYRPGGGGKGEGCPGGGGGGAGARCGFGRGFTGGLLRGGGAAGCRITSTGFGDKVGGGFSKNE